jgi:hypothetical protein
VLILELVFCCGHNSRGIQKVKYSRKLKNILKCSIQIQNSRRQSFRRFNKIPESSRKLYTPKTKTRNKNKFRSSTVMVLKMFFFGNQKCSLFEKNVLFSRKNHDLCLKKKHFWHFFGTGPESERNNEHFFQECTISQIF